MDTPVVSSPRSPLGSSLARRSETPNRREKNVAVKQEIDKWMAISSKTSSTKMTAQQEVEEILVSSMISNLRDLQKEIADTNWMFEHS
jgi:ABC-type thiamine transport system substrate-binding protein